MIHVFRQFYSFQPFSSRAIAYFTSVYFFLFIVFFGISQVLGVLIRVQAPFVRKVDSTSHWINYYPLDSAIGFRNTCPLDSAIQLLNNWGQVTKPLTPQPLVDVLSCCGQNNIGGVFTIPPKLFGTVILKSSP